MSEQDNACDCYGFDRPLNGTMQCDFDVPHTLQIQARARPATPIAVAGKRVTVNAVSGFEAGIPGLLACCDAAKERLERCIDAPQDILAGREVGQLAGSFSPDRFQLVRLVVIVSDTPLRW